MARDSWGGSTVEEGRADCPWKRSIFPTTWLAVPWVQGRAGGVGAKATHSSHSPFGRSLDGGWKRCRRAARAGGDLQLLLPRAQGAHPGERGRAGNTQPHVLGEVGALWPDRDQTALRARPRRRP